MINRIDKVSSLIKRLIASQLLNLGDLSKYVTVKDVEISKDLKTGYVWLGIIAKDIQQQQKIFEQIIEYKLNIQQFIADNIRTKYTPRLVFKIDKSGEYVERIDRLIKKANKANI